MNIDSQAIVPIEVIGPIFNSWIGLFAVIAYVAMPPIEVIGPVFIAWIVLVILPFLVYAYRHRLVPELQVIFWITHLFYILFALLALTIGIPGPFVG
jgi:hypothetical protein